MPPVLEVANLRKRFGKTVALDGGVAVDSSILLAEWNELGLSFYKGQILADEAGTDAGPEGSPGLRHRHGFSTFINGGDASRPCAKPHPA